LRTIAPKSHANFIQREMVLIIICPAAGSIADNCSLHTGGVGMPPIACYCIWTRYSSETTITVQSMIVNMMRNVTSVLIARIAELN
jgi:hypothetical protein